MVHLKVPGFVLDFIVLLAIKLPAFFFKDTGVIFDWSQDHFV